LDRLGLVDLGWPPVIRTKHQGDVGLVLIPLLAAAALQPSLIHKQPIAAARTAQDVQIAPKILLGDRIHRAAADGIGAFRLDTAGSPARHRFQSQAPRSFCQNTRSESAATISVLDSSKGRIRPRLISLRLLTPSV